MTPTIIVEKNRALQAAVDDLAKAIETGNLDRAQNLLGALQRARLNHGSAWAVSVPPHAGVRLRRRIFSALCATGRTQRPARLPRPAGRPVFGNIVIWGVQ